MPSGTIFAVVGHDDPDWPSNDSTIGFGKFDMEGDRIEFGKIRPWVIGVRIKGAGQARERIVEAIVPQGVGTRFIFELVWTERAARVRINGFIAGGEGEQETLEDDSQEGDLSPEDPGS